VDSNSSPSIPRLLETTLEQTLDEGGKVILLYGPRQAGKTTLVKKLLGGRSKFKVLALTGDDPADQRELVDRDGAALARLVQGYDVLFVDEAQRIPQIGLILKRLHDAHSNLRIIATGSSSFELAAHATEPLTGRARIFTLFPIAVAELLSGKDRRTLDRALDDMLVHGLYPEICTAPSRDEKRRALKELTESYLYKDVIEFGGIRHADRIHDLLRLLAFQVGSEVSIAELGTSLGLGRDTVDRYIDILEKAFVVFRLRGYARNLRKEVTKMDKIYFHDVGVRNMVIGNLAEPPHRDDMGRLWENFLVAERRKIHAYHQRFASSWFWRLRTGAELDYLEEEDGHLRGYEFKYGEKSPRVPAAWGNTYPGSSYAVVNRNTWFDFILGGEPTMGG
jgi:predicted AAA+ superfamily ATPase